MQNELTVTFEGDHIHVIADGDKDFEFSEKLWSTVAELCRKHNCFNVLGVANSSKSVEAMEGYDHARLFEELGIGYRYRIAWVELNPAAQDMASFIETVLINRGLPGKVFSSVDDAEKWLLGHGRQHE